MSCIYCTDPNGDPCYPMYGFSPHCHFFGADDLLHVRKYPRELWPDNFVEDPPSAGNGHLVLPAL